MEEKADLALTLTHTYRQAMIEEFDLDQDGEISEAEFVSGPFHQVETAWRILLSW